MSAESRLKAAVRCLLFYLGALAAGYGWLLLDQNDLTLELGPLDFTLGKILDTSAPLNIAGILTVLGGVILLHGVWHATARKVPQVMRDAVVLRALHVGFLVTHFLCVAICAANAIFGLESGLIWFGMPRGLFTLGATVVTAWLAHLFAKRRARSAEKRQVEPI